MAFEEGRDLVKINGRVYTRARALALGLVVVTGSGESEQVQATAKAATVKPPRAPASNRARKAARATQEGDDVALNRDGTMPLKRRARPLVPRNVKNGEPITDEAELARIAAETAAIEAAAKVAREAVVPEEYGAGTSVLAVVPAAEDESEPESGAGGD